MLVALLHLMNSHILPIVSGDCLQDLLNEELASTNNQRVLRAWGFARPSKRL